MVGRQRASSAPCTRSARPGSTFLRDELVRHFAAAGAGLAAVARALRVLDVGCGGGLICEPLARLGGRVTGLDPAPENIEAARRHAAGQGLAIDYVDAHGRGPAAEGRQFDAVVCLEVVEHVPDVRRVPEVVRGAGAAGRADAALDPQPHASRPICWPSSAPSTCCAGCRSARTSGTAS